MRNRVTEPMLMTLLILFSVFAFLMQGRAHGYEMRIATIQKSSNSIEFHPAGEYTRGYKVEIYDGDKFLLECFIPDKEVSGWCGHKKTYMTWKVKRYKNWLNPSTDEVKP